MRSVVIEKAPEISVIRDHTWKPPVLVVSEDPNFIERASVVLETLGARVIGCLGPANAACELFRQGSCALVAHSAAVLVDAPEGGRFRSSQVGVQAGSYAEELKRRHPATQVFLCGIDDTAGPTGEVMCVPDREDGLYLLSLFVVG